MAGSDVFSDALSARAKLGYLPEDNPLPAELSVREQFQYPPFAVFVSFLFRGAKEAVSRTEEMLERTFAPYNISFYGAPSEAPGKVLRRGLIRVPKSQWPDPELAALIQALPPAIRVEVNPDRIV